MWAYNELYHHGVKGQRWGVRRYQNYDGTYTKKGLARYNEVADAYDTVKSNYKSGTVSKTDLKSAKIQLKKAKKQLRKDYAGDKGKELYRQGKTISDNDQKRHVVNTVTTAVAATALAAYRTIDGLPLMSQKSRALAKAGAAAVAALSSTIGIGQAAKTLSDNKKLRAYYAHSGSR